MNTSHEMTQPSWRPWKIRLITPSYWWRNWDSVTCSRSCIFWEAELGLEPRWFCLQTQSSVCTRKVSHTLKPWMQWVSNNILYISDARRWHDSLVIVKFSHLNLKLMVNKSIFRKQRRMKASLELLFIWLNLEEQWVCCAKAAFRLSSSLQRFLTGILEIPILCNHNLIWMELIDNQLNVFYAPWLLPLGEKYFKPRIGVCLIWWLKFKYILFFPSCFSVWVTTNRVGESLCYSELFGLALTMFF